MDVNMKNKIYFCCLMFLIAVSESNAINWKDHDLQVVEEKREGNKKLFSLRDKKGRLFELLHDQKDANSKKQINRVLEFLEYIYRLKFIKVSAMRFVASPQSIQATVNSKSLTCSSKDYLSYVPTHMLFIYNNDNSLEYNFRIVVNNIFVRIKGIWDREEIEKNDLCAQLELAVKNPSLYLRKRDPEYLLSLLSDLEKKVKTLQRALLAMENKGFLGGNRSISETIILTVLKYKNQNPQAGLDEIMNILKEKNMQASKKEVKAILLVFYNKIY